MTHDQMVRGTNFTCFHAGPREGWTQFRLEPPDVPLPARGKLFLRKFLGSAGLEMSLNVVPPGKGIPFLHRHRENDEVYVVVGGRGQFLVDGECIDVQEGSVLRLDPGRRRDVHDRRVEDQHLPPRAPGEADRRGQGRQGGQHPGICRVRCKG